MKAVSPSAEVYIDFSFTLYTPNFANAITVEAATSKTLNKMARRINVPIIEYESEIQEENGGICKTVIKAKTEGRTDFPDYKQAYAWRDMIHNIADHTLTKWRLKSRLLASKFPSGYCYALRRTAGSDISSYNCTI